jgi:hypothetical protein
MVKRNFLTAILFLLCILLSAYLASAFSVIYSGTCFPNATNISVYNESDALVAFDEWTGNYTGCWNDSFYTLEIDNENISIDTEIEFYLNGLLVGTDTFNYTENSFVTLNLTDSQGPFIELISPANDSSVGSGNVTFYYNVTDHNNITNCSILIDGSINQTDDTIEINTTLNFTVLNLSQTYHTWQILCYDNSSKHNPGYSEIYEFTVLGYGIIDCSLYNPSSDRNVTRDRIFNFTILTECIGGDCGDVNVSLDPFSVSEQKSWWQKIIDWLSNAITGLASGTLVSTIPGATPFYTLDPNPESCGSMGNGDNCYTTWRVNATGSLGDYEFFAFCNSSLVGSNETLHINITIVNNSAPSIDAVNITTPAFTDTVIYCWPINYSDADGDPATYYYAWYDNDVLISGATANNLDCGTTSGCDKYDNITCAITPNDGYMNGTSKNATVTISNSPPDLNIPNICIEENNSYTIDLDSYSSDADGDSFNFTNTNSTHINVTINSTTNVANFTPTPGFLGIEYINITADDGENIATQAVMVTVAPDYAPDVVSVTGFPSHVYRTDIMSASCDADPVFEASLDVTIQYKKAASSVWENMSGIYYDGTSWIGNVLTNSSDDWLGVYDFRCRFKSCLDHESNYMVSNGSAIVVNNEPNIDAFYQFPTTINRSELFNISIICNASDIEDDAPDLNIEIKYELPGMPGWLDCSEIRTGNSWSCVVWGNESSIYLGPWNFRCIASDTDGGAEQLTVLGGVNVTNNPPVIDLPDDFTINKTTPESLFDVNDYASDFEDADELLDYAVVNQTNTSIVMCFVAGDDYLNCVPLDLGASNVTVQVTDTDNGTANDTIEIIVEEINHYPEIFNASFNDNNSFVAGDDITCSAWIRDEDNDNITQVDSYIWSEGLYNSSVNFTYAYYSGNLSANCTGVNWSDGKYCSWTLENVIGPHGVWHCDWLAIDIYDKFNFVVLNGTMNNTPPIIEPIPYVLAVEGKNTQFYINATDPNMDILTYYMNSSKGTLNSTTGWFNWTPGFFDIGNHTINFSVSDGTDNSSITTVIEVFSSFCSDCVVMFYGHCQTGSGDVDVYQSGDLVATEAYGNESGCFNNFYDIGVVGGPEPGCDIREGEQIDFYIHANYAGNYTFNCSPAMVNLSLITGPGVCGNSLVEIGEECDSDNLLDNTCSGLGIGTGTLACTDNCSFDTSNCGVRRRGGGGSTCRPIWQCSEWSECYENKTQTRDCLDLNECYIIDGVPATMRRCAYAVESCFDATMNQDESDVDCGGTCGANCRDGMTCNTGDDCQSSVCENGVCVSCNDGRLNQGEVGIDCGGPCVACQIPEQPRPPECEDRVSSWHILIAIIILILVGYYGEKYLTRYLAKKSKAVPGWLLYLKEQPTANAIGIVLLIAIGAFAVLLDNACFEQCLVFKSKHLLGILSVVGAGLLGMRWYAQVKNLVLKGLPFGKYGKELFVAIIAVALVAGSVFLHIYFTTTCGTCFDGIQNQDETGIDCGGICRPCPQLPAEETSPLLWFIPILAVLVVVGAILGFLAVRQFVMLPPVSRKPGLKPEISEPGVRHEIVEPEPPKEEIKRPLMPPKPPAPPKKSAKIMKTTPEPEEVRILDSVQKEKEEIHKLFVKAYKAIDDKNLEEAQKIAAELAKRYRTLPRELRDEIYNEVMILYNKIEKELL